MKKILVVDHNALDPDHRAVYDRIALQGGLRLRLVVPEKWHNNYVMLTYSEEARDAPYEIHSSRVLFPRRTHRLIYCSLLKHLRAFQPDIVYVNAEPENFQTFEAALLNSSVGSRLVFSSWRNIDHARVGFPYKFSFLNKWIEKFVLKRSTHGVVFNDTARRIFAASGFDKTTVIPPPIDTSVFLPRTSERRSGTFTLGYVGRLVKAKGVDLVLNALCALPSDCRAIIVGDGEEKSTLMRYAGDRKIHSRVEFINPVAPHVVPELFARMDVVVLPSRTTPFWREQFGRVLLEAMACGVAVVGSTSGEIPSVIGNAGLVFREDSVEDLVSALQKLKADAGLRQKLTEAGVTRVNSLFSLEVVAAQYYKLFLSL